MQTAVGVLCRPRMMPSYADELAVARTAVDQAGRLALQYFGTTLAIEYKADRSPVTAADRGAEEALRQTLGAAFPHDGMLGEELGASDGTSGRRWIVDPIDGTQSFIRGVPLYGVLVALEIDGTAQIGVAHFPGLGETVAAARRQGCWWNGRRARVSTTPLLEEAAVGYSDARMTGARLGDDWGGLLSATRVQRGWGDCYGHCLVATGRLDVMLDAAMNPWDCAALIPILEEAGGRFTDWRGEARIDGGDAFSTNGVLHEAVLRCLNR
jgi:histidinol phosphatase-like enzyme (inositol monophosphatase family)